MSRLHEEQDLFSLTTAFIHSTSQNIFLTGKAGTGKTTFLKHIRETCKKNLVVVAPTGVAAINAGGVTAHSFFQLPLGLYYPGSFHRAFDSESQVTDRHHLLRNLRLSNEKKELIQSLELIIIDEVSMLRCDLLDAIDVILRYVRSNQREAFGGIQMLFIGDLFQLPPVVKDDEWQWLKEFYQSPFFFEAQVLKQAAPLCIEFQHVYRQHDEHFIQLLNRIRNNAIHDDDIEKLNGLYKPGFKLAAADHFITLTTHNYKADEINLKELKKLGGKEYLCEATVAGEFPDRNYPVEKTMRLKAGAQIMFVRNDTEEKKYFNGKIGLIKTIADGEDDPYIEVEFPEEKRTIRVGPVSWENIRYSFDESSNKINEEQLGSFTQYPIRLAWAVTIHKSQGLTFQQVIIDAGQAFAAGQVYVALSRCVSMEGIVLLSKIQQHVITTDPAIVAFMDYQMPVDAMLPLLEKEKERYTLRKIKLLFNIQFSLVKTNEFIAYLGERQLHEKEKFISLTYEMKNVLIQLNDVGEKFLSWVDQLSVNGLNNTIQKQLDGRLVKAKAYFEKELDEKINKPLLEMNKELQQKNKVRKLLKEMKSFMIFFEHFTNRYRNEPVHIEEKFSPSKPAFSVKEIPEEASQHLFQLLRQIRRQFAEEENVAPYMVCHDAALIEMSTYFPQTITDLAMIKGMGDRSLNKYGEAFLTAIQKFSELQGLTARMDLKEDEMRKKREEKKNKPASEGDSRTASFKLFGEGKTIEEIASIRQMASSTVEGHLAHFVKTGELDVYCLLPKEKFERISEAIRKTESPGLRPVKEILGDSISYAEIRFVFNAMNTQE